MTDTNGSRETIDLAAVHADDKLLDAAGNGSFDDAEPEDSALAVLLPKRRDVNDEPVNPAHTRALERAIGLPLGDSPLVGGSR